MNKFNIISKKLVVIGIVIVLLSIYPVCRGVHLTKHHKILNIKKYKIVKKYRTAKEQLVEKYLFGKSGIEIGGHWKNDFHLYEHGPYLNVDFTAEDFFNQNGKQREVETPGQAINIVALGDDLPFKDNTFDYVFTSHVMEHFFDPVKAIQEHLRVIKKGGVLVYIIPHVDVIYDKGRDITDWKEIAKRHSGKLKINDYYFIERSFDIFNKTKFSPNDTGMVAYSVLKSKVDNSKEDYFVNNVGNKINKKDLKVFTNDNHHHWNVWRPTDFLEMAKHFGFNVIEWKEKDDNYGNGFVVVIQK